MDDEIDDARDGSQGGAAAAVAADLEWCRYPGCTEPGRPGDGLCVKHTISLSRRDPEAVEAARQFHAVHDPLPEEPKRNWAGRRDPDAVEIKSRGPTVRIHVPLTAAGAEEVRKRRTVRAERPAITQPGSQEKATMVAKITCDKCGRQFGPKGIGPHRAKCHGPVDEKAGPACETCGKVCASTAGLRLHRAKSACGDEVDQAFAAARREAKAKAKPVASSPTPVSAETVEVCGIAGCGRAKGHAGHHYRSRKAGDAKPKRKYTRRAAVAPASEPAVAVSKPTTGSRLPATKPPAEIAAANPPDGNAAAGRAFLRLAELLGLASIADCPHPDGRLFLNTATGQAAIMTLTGQLLPAEVVCG